MIPCTVTVGMKSSVECLSHGMGQLHTNRILAYHVLGTTVSHREWEDLGFLDSQLSSRWTESFLRPSNICRSRLVDPLDHILPVPHVFIFVSLGHLFNSTISQSLPLLILE